MKSAAIIVAASVAATATAFQQPISAPRVARADTSLYEYIPSGMSKEQWRKIKEQEKNKNKGKNLGQVGITSFKSRSFAEWQKAGGKNLFPVDPNSVKDESEIPYMQRAGGSADGADLKGGAKKKGPTFFQFGGKKKAPEPEPEPEKKKNWWTLN
mmetsp:Transcript_16754/g.24933  ORF Transcript_16754/g.24933 Transcript_16754/m.24933 type:complete len:155 (-) Transcript_16754:115-579(-)